MHGVRRPHARLRTSRRLTLLMLKTMIIGQRRMPERRMVFQIIMNVWMSCSDAADP